MRIYKARYRWDYSLEWVDVDRVTEKSVFTKHGVQRRETEGLSYCDTFIDAKLKVLSVLRERIDASEQELKSLKQSLAAIEAETPDTVKETTRSY